MKNLVPFGTPWPMNATLRERAACEREAFRSWVDGLAIPSSQRRVLIELLGLMDEREFVCVTYEAELARRTGLGESLGSVIDDLAAAGLLTSHRAADVFQNGRSGLVLRVRRPDVVLTVEAAGTLWLADSWTRKHRRGVSL